MDFILWFLWEVVIAAVETGLIYYLFVKRIGGEKGRLEAVVGAGAVFSGILLMKIFFVPGLMGICGLWALCVGYACLVFGKGRGGRVLWGCVPAVVVVAGDTLAYGIASFFHYGNLAWAWRAGSMQFYVSATSVMLQIIIVLIAANGGKGECYRLTAVQLVFLIGMSLISIVAVNLQMGVVYTLTGFVGTKVTQQVAVFVSLCFLIVLTALVWLVGSLGKESRKNMEKSLEIQQAQLENGYYKSLEISVRGLRELRHDIANHMHVMKILIDEGDKEELKKYFSSIEDQYQTEQPVFVTDNTMLNAMLTSKQMTAREYHIRMQLSYTTKRSIPLSLADFCSLIGNMIDNGIEACQKVTDENARYLDISVGDRGDMVYIKVKNSSDGIYRVVNGELRTTKNGGGHGIGLRRIKNIAESGGGFLDLNPRPDEFTAVVMLPSAEEGVGLC